MRPKLLVVEDQRSLSESIADYFELSGFDVAVANDRQEAEARIAADAYDAMITDLRLSPRGGDEGLDLIAVLQKRAPAAVVVILTAYPSPLAESFARRTAGCLMLHKPQPLHEVEGCVRALLADAQVIAPR
jgi:DNA-binding response OmpR family regulator